MKSFNFYLDASNYFINIENYQKLNTNEKEYNHISAVLLAWVSLEAYINALSESLSKGKRLTTYETDFLNEIEFCVNDEGGINKKTIRPSTTKKILFLVQNFSKINIKKFKQTMLWNKITNFEELRNSILHYKEKRDINVSLKKAQEYRDTTKEVIDYFNRIFR